MLGTCLTYRDRPTSDRRWTCTAPAARLGPPSPSSPTSGPCWSPAACSTGPSATPGCATRSAGSPGRCSPGPCASWSGPGWSSGASSPRCRPGSSTRCPRSAPACASRSRPSPTGPGPTGPGSWRPGPATASPWNDPPRAEPALGVAAAVPQHLHGLLDPAPPGRLPLGLGHPLGVLALVGEGQAVEGGPGLGVGGQGAGQVGRRVDGAWLVVGGQLDHHGVAGRDPGGLAQGAVDRQVVAAAVDGHGAAERLAVDGAPDRGPGLAEGGRHVQRDLEEHAAVLGGQHRLEAVGRHGQIVTLPTSPTRQGPCCTLPPAHNAYPQVVHMRRVARSEE